MGDFARVGGSILLGLICIAVGWFGRGWWDGSSVSVKDAAEQSQQFVVAAVEQDRGIVAAQAEADTAAERVREVIRKVYVNRDCPEGTGAVSVAVADRLRAEFSKAGQDTTER